MEAINRQVAQEDIPKPGKSLGTCMIELYERHMWTDVDFRCKDHEEGESIKAHKIVLAARSPVFRAMFFGPCADGKDEVVLDSVEKDIFDLFLRYVYSDFVTLKEETASAVMEIAHRYQVPSLVQFCADYLSTTITADNACAILTLAMLYDVKSLKSTCASFMDNNAESVLHSDGFLELPLDCLTYILKGDTFFAKENVIFKRSEEWSTKKILEDGLEKNGSNIRKTLGESFFYLRLPTMDSKMLMECTRKKGYFQAEEYENIIDNINGIPKTIAPSNLSVPRVPVCETILLNENNNEHQEICTDGVKEMCITFDISVSKDVILTNIFLVNSRYMFAYYKNITSQWPAQDNIPSSIGLEMFGSMTINSLGFKHDFIFSSDQKLTDICLKQPLLLKRENSPFNIKINIQSKNSQTMRLKSNVLIRGENKIVRNKTGHIQVCKMSGNSAAIGGIKFQNFSNRGHGNSVVSTIDC